MKKRGLPILRTIHITLPNATNKETRAVQTLVRGNLGEDVRPDLQPAFNKWYSANIFCHTGRITTARHKLFGQTQQMKRAKTAGLWGKRCIKLENIRVEPIYKNSAVTATSNRPTKTNPLSLQFRSD